MDNICPIFKAAPRMRHRVAANRSALASWSRSSTTTTTTRRSRSDCCCCCCCCCRHDCLQSDCLQSGFVASILRLFPMPIRHLISANPRARSKRVVGTAGPSSKVLRRSCGLSLSSLCEGTTVLRVDEIVDVVICRFMRSSGPAVKQIGCEIIMMVV
jgi:hypothetical protein